MGKKIVYFIEKPGEVNGVQAIIPKILENMPTEYDVQAYFINILNEKNEYDEEYEQDSIIEKSDEDSADNNNAEYSSEEINDASDNAFDSDDKAFADIDINKDSLAEEEEAKPKELSLETDDEEENNQDSSDSVDQEGALKIIDIADCDFSQFKDATFIVPINYLFFLLPYIAEYKDAKICPYIYDNMCVKRFLGQIVNPNVQSIISLLNDTRSCLFLDKHNSSGWDSGLDQYGECVIPQSTDICSYNSTERKSFDSKTISVAWIGAVSPAAYDCIRRICEDIYNIFTTVDEETGKVVSDIKIDFHVLGQGKAMWQFNFYKYWPMFRFIFPGQLDGEELDEYICKNIDVAFGYNMNIIKGAMCYIPSLIPTLDDIPARAKRTYVYIKDADDYILCWKKKELHELRYDSYTMEDVFERLLSEKSRNDDAKQCGDFAVDRYSYISNAKRIIDVSEISEMTVEKLLENESIASVLNRLEEYRAVSEENASASYYDYFFRNKTKSN